jgi:hypothetical protein
VLEQKYQALSAKSDFLLYAHLYISVYPSSLYVYNFSVQQQLPVRVGYLSCDRILLSLDGSFASIKVICSFDITRRLDTSTIYNLYSLISLYIFLLLSWILSIYCLNSFKVQTTEIVNKTCNMRMRTPL